jgi:hypothetical protein
MKTILTTVSLLFFATLFAQQNNGELPEGKYAKFMLNQVSLAKVDGIYYYDLDGTGTKYFVNFSFGRNTFDLELVEKATGKIVWATYGIGIDLRVDKKKQSGSEMKFQMEKTAGNITTTYEVSFTTSGLLTASFSEVDNKTKNVIRTVLAQSKVKGGQP